MVLLNLLIADLAGEIDSRWRMDEYPFQGRKHLRSRAAGHEHRDPIASSLIEALATQHQRQRVESPVANPGNSTTS